MRRILGLDLGTNSIGWTIRDTQLEENQFEKFGVITFKTGVGKDDKGNYTQSYAAERTKNRSIRRLYQARKYRLWETLRILIENDYCPLSMDDLDQWRKYDKERGFFRKYPIHAKTFEQWIRLDFNNDNKPDYSSPYQLRKELVEEKLDLNIQVNRFKIGRALYHIAQRRGFKSSRKEKKQENENGEIKTSELQFSEKKRSSKIEDLMSKHNSPTIGHAFACEENLGSRIRLDWIQYTIRQHYKDEISKIFTIQNLDQDSMLYKDIVESRKNKNDGSIFYRRPLRSQKGLVGICTLEQKTFEQNGKTITTGKPRCPVSHPLFEEFRAWAFLNNIQYKINKEDEWQRLPLPLKEEIYQQKFFRKSKDYFNFSEIAELIEKKNGNCILNYSNKTNVSGCPISARLKNILGDNWQTYVKERNELRTIKKRDGSIKEHNITYKIEDIWHILFSFEDEESVGDFAKEKLELNEDQIKDFMAAWKQLPDGYSMLSLSAIKKIIPFLRKGLIYTEAVLLANMPTVLEKKLWKENEEYLTAYIRNLIEKNRSEKQLLSIVNDLISKWYASEFKVGFKNPDYQLDEKDIQLIKKVIQDSYGSKTWGEKSDEEKEKIISTVTFLYQGFFRDDFEWEYIKNEKYYIVKIGQDTFYKNLRNNYYKIPHLLDSIKMYLKGKFNIEDKRLEKLYHPSQIEIYPKAKPNREGKILLQNPKTGSFKNPMAMRTLYELRKLINYLISLGDIDEEDSIVVEVARQLNDSNKRWAIETYQRRREEENKEFAKAITELLKEPDSIGRIQANPDSNDDIDKFRLWYEQIKYKKLFKKPPAKNRIDKEGKEIGNSDSKNFDWNNIRNEIIQKVIEEKDLIKKYRLWKEQGCLCIYTGNTISLSDLFDENVIDFEHTIPRSISFDNSLANLTVCFAHYNRNIKKNRIPTELENYNEDWGGFTSIESRLKDWKDRIEELTASIEFWKKKSKQAQDKDAKDYAIRQRHLWQFELDYWKNKLDRFTMTEVKSGFKNSQLVDTQFISKYAFHYLKTVFNNVNVQKGSVTAEFRKIYGIQPKDEEKDRSSHYHHAIDAAVLTLIPTSAKREEVLKKSYELYEKWKLGRTKDKQYRENPYPDFKLKYINEIEKNILINNVAKDKALIPAKKIFRKRGKIVYLRDKNGKLILDDKGKNVFKIITGDSIRGQLHLETFYSKIKNVKRDENGNPVIGNNGEFVFEEKNDGYTFVLRKPVSAIKKLEEIVDPHLRKIIEQQLDGRTLEKAFAEGIWMINKSGEKINKIRHLRCFADDVKDPLPIKNQTYLSKHEHKQYYYSKNATSFLYALYEDEKGTRSFEPLNLFDAVEIRREKERIKKEEDFFEPKKIIGRGKKEGELIAVLKPGQKVLFYKDKDKEEPKELSKEELSKRLYFIKRLYDADKGTIQFQYHLEARNDKQLSEAFPKEKFKQYGKNGFSKFSFEKPWPRLLMSPISFDFLIEGMDFKVTPDGEINWINRSES